MISSKIHEKKCGECNQSLTFEDFCRINPSLILKKAHDYWNDSMILIYCPDCYYKLPEKPFKRRRRYEKFQSRNKEYS